MPQLIGILGGTFDPIHHGHLRPALEVWDGLGMDEMRLIPLREPPHRDQPSVEPKHRLRMVALAVANQRGFLVDDRELRREGPSYTLDTLRSLQTERRDSDRFCVLLGADAFTEFLDWHEPLEIMRLAHIIVMQRPETAIPHTPALQTLLRTHRTHEPNRLKDMPSGGILFFPVTPLAISATAIRALIAQGKSPRYLLPDAVLAYIEREGLYSRHE